MSTYPGNPALAPDVRKRILEAFRHSVEAAADGNREEALLGCDFVLRLDPTFEPVRALQEMIEQERSPEAIRSLSANLGDEPTAPGVTSFTAAAPGLVATFHRLFEARRFGELLSAAQSQAAAVAGDAKLRELVAQAQARYDAEPFVREQLDLARRALGAGKLDDVDAAVQRARELDPSHPGLAEIERMRASAASMSNSLQIDWDEEDHAIPPPAEVDQPPVVEPAPAAAPPPAATSRPIAAEAPVAPPADESPPLAEPELSQTPAPEGVAAAEADVGEPEFAPLDDLALPEIDFARAEEAPVAGEPVAAPVAEEEPGGGLDLDGLPDDLQLPEFGVDAVAGDEPPAAAADAEPAAADGDERVQALLDEGEAAFGDGDYQSAIDAWSRIFLIDIDNEEAARRIERARQLKSEQERQVEEVFHEGVAHFDAGEWEAARDAFRRVLEEQPSYVLAREYLEKLEERMAEGADAGGLSEMAPLPEMAPAAMQEGDEVPLRRRPGGEEILVPPEPGDEQEVRAPAVEGFAAKKKRGFRPTPAFLGIGGAVLLALGAGGWWLASNWSRLFPNAPAPAVASAPDSATVVARARKTHEEGRTAVAIAQLRRVPPQDASYAEAQSLISQWESLVEKAPESSLTPEQEARRDELLSQASAAVDSGEHFVARRILAEASTIAPLDGPAAELLAKVEQRATVFADELAYIKDGEYERALNLLWRRYEADPADRDVRRLMIDSYYNLTVADLQRGDPSSARAKLREARNLDRSDPMLQRLDRFCAAYEKREQDLLYRIFVKYLPGR